MITEAAPISSRLRSGAAGAVPKLFEWLRLNSRALVAAGLIVSVCAALYETYAYTYVPPEWVRRRLNTPNEDVRNLYIAASHARLRDIPGWFAGPWIYPGLGYYRPLTSLLYFAEYRLFDQNFTAYNRVTWLLHGINTGLLYLFTVSLFRNRPILRTVCGLIAVLYFTTQYCSLLFSTVFAVSWWPAQNDVLSLTFGLLSLLLLDQALLSRRKSWLFGALFAFACTIGSKEMGYAVAPVAIALIWHRRRKPSYEMAWFAGIGAFFWFFRKMVVPNPWGQNYFTDWVARKAVFYYCGPPYFLAASHVWWPIAAAVLILIFVAAGWRLRWPVVWIGFASVLSAALCAQFLDPNGTWGLILESNSLAEIGSVLIYLSAILVFWRYRRQEPGLFAMMALVLVFVPILQFAGYHYLYWPSAFLALADGCFFACLLRLADEWRRTANWSLPIRRSPATIDADA